MKLETSRGFEPFLCFAHAQNAKASQRLRGTVATFSSALDTSTVRASAPELLKCIDVAAREGLSEKRAGSKRGKSWARREQKLRFDPRGAEDFKTSIELQEWSPLWVIPSTSGRFCFGFSSHKLPGPNDPVYCWTCVDSGNVKVYSLRCLIHAKRI